jgi:methylamine dehydrogenase accessory protein MauD
MLILISFTASEFIGVASYVLLWLLVLVLAFLLLGALRALGVLQWRLEQLEATTPSRLGRSGLKVGKKAPDFTLPAAGGGAVSLDSFAGRKLLLVFTQGGCGPCHDIMPELNKLHEQGEPPVLVVFNGDAAAARQWAQDTKARCPIAVQQQWKLSRHYEVFATPFAFLVNEQGVIASKGIINNKQHIGYVLAHRGAERNGEKTEAESPGSENREADQPFSLSRSEVSHV